MPSTSAVHLPLTSKIGLTGVQQDVNPLRGLPPVNAGVRLFASMHQSHSPGFKEMEDFVNNKNHWEQVYSTKQADSVSWYQEHAEKSVELILSTGVAHSASIIDVGSGASRLIDDLLSEGFANITAVDLSAGALAATHARIGARANRMQWIAADITNAVLPRHAYDVWHDRAVFHFLTEPQQRKAYVSAVINAVKPGGHVIVATFAEDGPTMCSGLPVQRYSAHDLHGEFGASFNLVHSEREVHATPFGTEQKFVYCYCRKANS